MWKRIEYRAIERFQVDMRFGGSSEEVFTVLFDSCGNQGPFLGNAIRGDRIEDTGDGNLALFSNKYTFIIPKPAYVTINFEKTNGCLDRWPVLFSTRYMSIKYRSKSEITGLAGIESYHKLEALWVGMYCDDKLRDLNGIEYCSRLRYLGLPCQCIQDLSPLYGLPIVSLFVPNNPITTLGPVDQSHLEDLTICSEMVDLLSDRDFVSLKNLVVECYDEDFGPPADGECQKYDIESMTCFPKIREFQKMHPQCNIEICLNNSWYEDWTVMAYNLPGRSVRLNETSVYASGEPALGTRY